MTTSRNQPNDYYHISKIDLILKLWLPGVPYDSPDGSELMLQKIVIRIKWRNTV